MGAPAAGAEGARADAVATGAGVPAMTAGCGCAGCAAVGAVYGAGAAAGASLSLAQPVTIKTRPARANTELRSIDFSFRAAGALALNIARRLGDPHSTLRADCTCL